MKKLILMALAAFGLVVASADARCGKSCAPKACETKCAETCEPKPVCRTWKAVPVFHCPRKVCHWECPTEVEGKTCERLDHNAAQEDADELNANNKY